MMMTMMKVRRAAEKVPVPQNCRICTFIYILITVNICWQKKIYIPPPRTEWNLKCGIQFKHVKSQNGSKFGSLDLNFIPFHKYSGAFWPFDESSNILKLLKTSHENCWKCVRILGGADFAKMKILGDAWYAGIIWWCNSVLDGMLI